MWTLSKRQQFRHLEQPQCELFDHIISLGFSCQAAYQLQRLGLRTEAFPFDWIFIEDKTQLINALEKDFDGWLEYSNLEESSFTQTAHKRVVDKRYNTVHQHIFPMNESVAASYPEVKRITDRRVRRLLDLKGKNETILFIRTDIEMQEKDIEEIMKLGEVITKKYGPKAILLSINLTEKFEIRRMETGRKKVILYELYNGSEIEGQDWRGYDPHWDLLLGRVRLKKFSLDLANDAYFENFYPCETDENGKKHRWSMGGGKLHLEKYGGCYCRLNFNSPVKTYLEAQGIHGETIFRIEWTGAAEYGFRIEHTSKQIKFITETWSPYKVFGQLDRRELGVCLTSIFIERG